MPTNRRTPLQDLKAARRLFQQIGGIGHTVDALSWLAQHIDQASRLVRAIGAFAPTIIEGPDGERRYVYFPADFDSFKIRAADIVESLKGVASDTKNVGDDAVVEFVQQVLDDEIASRVVFWVLSWAVQLVVGYIDPKPLTPSGDVMPEADPTNETMAFTVLRPSSVSIDRVVTLFGELAHSLSFGTDAQAFSGAFDSHTCD